MSSLRKFALVVLAVVATLGVVACGDDDESTSAAGSADTASQSTTAKQQERLTIAYIQPGPFPYYVRGVDGAKAAAKDLGVDLKVSNSQLKPEQEISNVEDAVSQNVDGIVLFSVGKASEKAALAKARAANIPVAVLYGYDKELEDQGAVFVQAPAPLTGGLAGTWVADNVKTGDVAIIQGQLGRGDAEAYTDGFKKALAVNGSLKVVASPAADWDRGKAQTAAQDALSAHPQLKALFVQNEDMALGAYAAVKAAGKIAQVKIVSQNGSPEGLKAVEDGQLAATVAWSPAQEAQMALRRLVEAVRDGEQADPKVCTTPTLLVTKDNVTDAPPWVPSAESTAANLKAECAPQQ